MPILFDGTANGFGPLGVSDFIINGSPITTDVADAVQNATVARTITAASTVTLGLIDPYRTILRQSDLQFGQRLIVDSLEFDLVQITKRADVLQVAFEAAVVAHLRTQTGIIATTTTTDITTWVQSLLAPGTPFVAEQAPVNPAVSVGRGDATTSPNEDSWTAIQRVVTSAGWRCFESNGTIYLGSDQFFLLQPSLGVLTEFTETIQNIDFDWDIGKPFGTASVTGMSTLWAYPPGGNVTTSGMGPMDGQPWLVQDMQRNLYSPQMTATLYVPQTPQQVIQGNPSSAPF